MCARALSLPLSLVHFLSCIYEIFGDSISDSHPQRPENTLSFVGSVAHLLIAACQAELLSAHPCVCGGSGSRLRIPLWPLPNLSGDPTRAQRSNSIIAKFLIFFSEDINFVRVFPTHTYLHFVCSCLCVWVICVCGCTAHCTVSVSPAFYFYDIPRVCTRACVCVFMCVCISN